MCQEEELGVEAVGVGPVSHVDSEEGGAGMAVCATDFCGSAGGSPVQDMGAFSEPIAGLKERGGRGVVLSTR